MIEANREAAKAAAEEVASNLRASSKRQLLSSANVDRFGAISGPGTAVGCLLDKGSSLVVDDGAYVEGVHLEQGSTLHVGCGSVVVGGCIIMQTNVEIGRDCVIRHSNMDCDSIHIADGAKILESILRVGRSRSNHKTLVTLGRNCILLRSNIQGMCKEFSVGDDYLAVCADLTASSTRGNVKIGSNMTLLTTLVQRTPLPAVHDVISFIDLSMPPNEAKSTLELTACEGIYIGDGVLSSANLLISSADRIYIGSCARLLTDWFSSGGYKYICNSVKLGLGSTLVSMDQAYKRSDPLAPKITLDIGNNASLIVGTKTLACTSKVKITVGDNGVGVI